MSACRNYVAGEIFIIKDGSVTQAPLMCKNHTGKINAVVLFPKIGISVV